MSDMARLIKEIANRCPNHQIPDDYLVIDVETSGLDWNPTQGKPAVIVQVGYAAVRKRKIIANFAHYLRRPKGTMSKESSEITGITDEILEKEGEQPKEFYDRFLSLLQLYRRADNMFVGHNIMSFDAPFMTSELGRQGIDFSFKNDECIDTGCLFKAAQMGVCPGKDESLVAFFERIRRTRSHVKWKLSLAIEKFKLNEKHDLNLDEAHDAGFDCKLAHLLLEHMRSLLVST